MLGFCGWGGGGGCNGTEYSVSLFERQRGGSLGSCLLRIASVEQQLAFVGGARHLRAKV